LGLDSRLGLWTGRPTLLTDKIISQNKIQTLFLDYATILLAFLPCLLRLAMLNDGLCGGGVDGGAPGEILEECGIAF
jgi:hypothetical protein